MNKILEGAKQAVKVARCDHELVRQPMLNASTTLDRFYCTKCEAIFYQPRPSYKLPTRRK